MGGGAGVGGGVVLGDVGFDQKETQEMRRRRQIDFPSPQKGFANSVSWRVQGAATPLPPCASDKGWRWDKPHKVGWLIGGGLHWMGISQWVLDRFTSRSS